jgi:hypothetical protein
MGDVVRTAGPTAEATLEANAPDGDVPEVGVPDGALGQHAENENEAVGPAKFLEPEPKPKTAKK